MAGLEILTSCLTELTKSRFLRNLLNMEYSMSNCWRKIGCEPFGKSSPVALDHPSLLWSKNRKGAKHAHPSGLHLFLQGSYLQSPQTCFQVRFSTNCRFCPSSTRSSFLYRFNAQTLILFIVSQATKTFINPTKLKKCVFQTPVLYQT